MQVDNPYIQEAQDTYTGITAENSFGEQYGKLRKQEHRIFSDESLLQLPHVDKSHPHANEWMVRKRSCKKLLHYLERKKPLQKIVEVGCGNGWLARQLAFIPGSSVTGVDIHVAELQQAARVFSHICNLQFIYGDIEQGLLKEARFDTIVFASSIQYFSSLNKTLTLCRELLRPGGEIHIIDSPFYTAATQPGAIERTGIYFRRAGFPALSNYYFHHSLDDLAGFSYTLFYRPRPLLHYLQKHNSPFPWLIIR